MAAKKQAAKAGAGAMAAGQAARSNPYVQRLVEDAALRDDLRTAFESARKAYGRMNGKGPTKALEDKKVQKDLKVAADSLKSAADTLRAPPKRKKRRGRLLLVAIVGAGLGARAQRGAAVQGARRAVRCGGGVRVHLDHHPHAGIGLPGIFGAGRGLTGLATAGLHGGAPRGASARSRRGETSEPQRRSEYGNPDPRSATRSLIARPSARYAFRLRGGSAPSSSGWPAS